jgi:hypothetical protein
VNGHFNHYLQAKPVYGYTYPSLSSRGPSKRCYGRTTPAVMLTCTAGTNLVTTTCTSELESAMHVDSIHI